MIRTDDNCLLKESFGMLDSDNDGKINEKDLAFFLRWTGQNPSSDEVKKMINTLTSDAKGGISFSDYFTFMRTGPLDVTEEFETMKEAFRVFDRHGTGLVSVKDISHILQRMGECFSEDQIKDVLRLGNKNKDGYMEFQDFLKLMNFKIPGNFLNM